MRFLVAAGIVVIGSAACGGSREPTELTDEEGTELTIVVENGWGQQSYQLVCGPSAGDVPQPADLCNLIERNEATMLHARDLNQVCVGGPGTPYIEVFGYYRREEIDTAPSACYGHPEAEALWLMLLPPLPEPTVSGQG